MLQCQIIIQPFTKPSLILTTLKEKSCENILRKEEQVTNIFSFSHNVFYPSPKNNLSYIYLASENAFSLGKSNNLLFGKE